MATDQGISENLPNAPHAHLSSPRSLLPSFSYQDSCASSPEAFDCANSSDCLKQDPLKPPKAENSTLSLTMSSKSQPWKTNWPNNLGDDSKHDPSRFAKSLGGGKGAQPLQNASADGTRVLRLDKFKEFIKTLERHEADKQ